MGIERMIANRHDDLLVKYFGYEYVGLNRKKKPTCADYIHTAAKLPVV